MIKYDTNIQWLDIKLQQSYTETVSAMFQKYSYLMQQTEYGHILDFSNSTENIKITDMYGWTSVVSIHKILTKADYRKLIIANTSIILDSISILPIYDALNPYKGFHGETKYNYKVKLLTCIRNNDVVRIRNGKDVNGKDIEFSTILFEEMSTNNDNGVYDITTKSGFFNANDIHLISSRWD